MQGLAWQDLNAVKYNHLFTMFVSVFRSFFIIYDVDEIINQYLDIAATPQMPGTSDGRTVTGDRKAHMIIDSVDSQSKGMLNHLGEHANASAGGSAFLLAAGGDVTPGLSVGQFGQGIVTEHDVPSRPDLHMVPLG